MNRWPMVPYVGMPGHMMGPMGDPGYLMQLLHMIDGAMPTEEMIHSYHTEALMDSTLRSLPSMARFSDTSLHCLHALVTAAGYLRRCLGGEMTEAVLRGLREQLRSALRNHADAKRAFGELTQSEAVRKSEVMQALGHMLHIADHAFQALRAASHPLLADPPAPKPDAE